jgi:hypothetical protein
MLIDELLRSMSAEGRRLWLEARTLDERRDILAMQRTRLAQMDLRERLTWRYGALRADSVVAGTHEPSNQDLEAWRRLGGAA